MAIPRLGGIGVGLGANQTLNWTQGIPAGQTNAISLAGGGTFVFPAGTYNVQVGPYTYLQYLDPVSNMWRSMPTAASRTSFVESDGTNWRLANTTGCVVGAFITTGGAGGPSTPCIGATATSLTITCSGSPTFSPIVGGALSTSGAPVVTTGGQGSGFTFPPLILIDAPPVGGIQATAIATLSGTGLPSTGAAFSYTNQGAGYVTVPTITIIPDSRDISSSTGLFSGTLPVVTGGALTGSGVLTGVLVTNHGTSFTSTGAASPAITVTTGGSGWTTLPSLSGVMNWSVVGITAISGAGGIFTVAPLPFSGSTAFGLTTVNHVIPGVGTASNAGSLVIGNPAYEPQLEFPRPARITMLASGAAPSTGANGVLLEDAGLGIQRVPTLVSIGVIGSGAAVTGEQLILQASLTGFLGASPVDTSFVQRI